MSVDRKYRYVETDGNPGPDYPEEKLKELEAGMTEPCPFCGWTPCEDDTHLIAHSLELYNEYYPHPWIPFCGYCAAHGPRGYSPQAARDNWNKREPVWSSAE